MKDRSYIHLLAALGLMVVISLLGMGGGPDPAEHNLVFWKTSKKGFRLGIQA